MLSIIRSSALKSDASIHNYNANDSVSRSRFQAIAEDRVGIQFRKKLLYISGSTSPQRDIKRCFPAQANIRTTALGLRGFGNTEGSQHFGSF